MQTTQLTAFLPDEAATLEFAGKLARVVGDTAIIYLHGQLGAGKTTFSRGFMRGLGHAGVVKSPTYTLVEPYQFEGFSLFHFDLYRVNDPHELEFIGIRDYFIPHAICLIEWPEYGSEFLPAPDLSCYLEPYQEGREIKLIANSAIGEVVLQKFIK